MTSRWFWTWIAFVVFVLAAGIVLVFGEPADAATDGCLDTTSQQDTRLTYMMTPDRRTVCVGTLPLRWWVERPCREPAAGCDPVVSAGGGIIYGQGQLRGGGTKPLRMNILNPGGDRAILFVHGGGFNAGSRLDHNLDGLRDLAARGFLVATIDYRFQADNPAGPDRNAMDRAMSAAVEDTLTAAAWLRATYGPSEVWLIGSSAGAITVVNAAQVGQFDGVVSIAGALTDGIQGPTPVLQIHYEDDVAVPYRPLNADLILLPGAGHAVKLSAWYEGRRWTHWITQWVNG